MLISLVFLFPPNYLIVREYSGYAIHWMLICLIIGIISLFIGNEKILYSSFFASGLIAFFLMNSFNTDLRLASFNNPSSISVLFANLTLSNDDENKTMNTIYLIDADIVLIEELTPDKIKLLQEIRSKYPYQSMLPRVDPLGKAVLSKFKFYEESSFGIFGNPILILGVINEYIDNFKIFFSPGKKYEREVCMDKTPPQKNIWQKEILKKKSPPFLKKKTLPYPSLFYKSRPPRTD